mgnify:CR=1 FL=1
MSGEVSGNDDIYSELMDEISSDDIQNTIDNMNKVQGVAEIRRVIH